MAGRLFTDRNHFVKLPIGVNALSIKGAVKCQILVLVIFYLTE
jgi:hypothetical protein